MVPVAPCPFDIEVGGFEARKDLVGAAEPQCLCTGEMSSVGQHGVAAMDGRVGPRDPVTSCISTHAVNVPPSGCGCVAVVRSRSTTVPS